MFTGMYHIQSNLNYVRPDKIQQYQKKIQKIGEYMLNNKNMNKNMNNNNDIKIILNKSFLCLNSNKIH